jgi:hypothetical protein
MTYYAYTMYISRNKDKILHHAKNTYADLLEISIYLSYTYNYLTYHEKKIINIIHDELWSKLDTNMKEYYLI